MGDPSRPGGGSAVSAEGWEDQGDPTCLAHPQGLTLQMWGKEESPVLGVLSLNCLRCKQVESWNRQVDSFRLEVSPVDRPWGVIGVLI